MCGHLYVVQQSLLFAAQPTMELITLIKEPMTPPHTWCGRRPPASLQVRGSTGAGLPLLAAAVDLSMKFFRRESATCRHRVWIQPSTQGVPRPTSA
jgi:hypothetical protein